MTMVQDDNRDNRADRAATLKRDAERKAKHDAPHAARILFDPFTFDPFGPVAGAAFRDVLIASREARS